MKKAPFILLKITLFLLTAIFFIGHNYAQAEEIPVRERLISVNKQDQNFTQALEAIANQAGIAINIHGQIPEGKRDLSMDQMPLGKAMAQVMKMYGVLNHAAAYNPDTGTVMLAILETSTMVARLPSKDEPEIEISLSMEPLTGDQISQLVPDNPIDYMPLTLAQIDMLEPDDESDYQPLSPEQMTQLEPENVDDYQPLTQEQIEQLKPENVDDYQFLSP